MPVYLPGLTFGGLGYGGASYGYSPYGSGVFPRLPVPVSGGYGGAPYGLAPYGSIDFDSLRVSSVNALDGFRAEVFFSRDVLNNAALTDPDNYVFTTVYGYDLTSVSVALGIPSGGGYSSVIVTHSGSTLGGQYTLTVSGVQDLTGALVGPPSATFFALGDVPTVVAQVPVADDGRTLQVDVRDSLGNPQGILPESEYSPGVGDVASYATDTEYPVPAVLQNAEQDSAEPARIWLTLSPMTSTSYTLTLSPSLAFSYEGSVLPSEDPNLDGVSLGVGESEPSPSGLVLSKADGVFYGWSLEDTSTRLVGGTTYRVDFAYTLTGATITPPVVDSTLLFLSISDGLIQINIAFNDSAGYKVLTVSSGTYSSTSLADWSALGSRTVSLIRNQKAAFYSVLLDGDPVVTFPVSSANGASSYAPGVTFVLSPSHGVSLFRVQDVHVTASSTLFTSTWNFIHGLTTTFVGSSVLTRPKVVTRYGPLVRGWGDATPATTSDVEVRVNGVAVDLAGINPYVGEIYPTVPIPLMAEGAVPVEVDYIWFKNPVMQMASLNTPGLTLNTWTRTLSGQAESFPAPLPSGAVGAAPRNRFPMSVVIGPVSRPSPKQIGHKYVGFQKGGYSALLNQPTTLLLNQNPHAVSISNLTVEAIRATGLFNGRTTPVDAGWELVGSDTGRVVGDGTYELVDASSGPYGVGFGGFYTRDLDLSVDTQVTDIARFRVGSYTPDGVFTGVGFGFHDGAHLVMVGALSISGVQHVGVLLDGTKAHLEEGWQIGPAVEAEATSTTTVRVAYAALPTGVGSESRFRIAEGVQAGVYTISPCGLRLGTDGLVTLTFSPALPVSPTEFGARDVELLFETPWDEDLISFRVYSRFPTGSATVYLGGGISGLVADLSEVAPFPAQTALLLPATVKGVMFWGSMSRRASSTSYWDLTQYQSDPIRIMNTVQGVHVSEDMVETPDDPWYRTALFGLSSANGDLLLKKTSANGLIPISYAYERVEPYLTPKVCVDFNATFSVESGILGAQDVTLQILDTAREVRLVPLVYVETATDRVLVPARPHVSLTGLQDPTLEGWVLASGGSVSAPYVQGQTLQFTKGAAQAGAWSAPAATDGVVEDVGVILEVTLSVQSYTVGSRGVGLLVGASCEVSSGQARVVYLSWSAGSLILRDAAYAVVDTFAYVWDDTEEHTYRVLCDPDADLVVLVVDDTVVGSTALSGFTLDATTTYLEGLLEFSGTGACAVTLAALSVTPLRVSPLSGETLGRTLGVYLRRTPWGDAPDPQDIDSYRIPRTDGANVLNSDLSALPVEMDWQSPVDVRIYKDPLWGVSVYRPDLPLPPGAPGTALPSETTDPAAAWINVEYADLPVLKSDRGSLAFGVLDRGAITQSRWASVDYRIRNSPRGFGIAPQGMVLNHATPLVSGEATLDSTPEVRVVVSRTPFLAYVPDSAVYADRIFLVQVDGVTIPASAYTFDKATQNLQFASTHPLPSPQYPVSITFVVGKPYTKDYVCNQPLEETVTVLNAGTPPVPKQRDLAPTRTLDPLAGEDPLTRVTFTDGPDSIYAALEFCETESGDDVYITIVSDDPGPGEGLSEIAMSGHHLTEAFAVPGGPGGAWRGSPVVAGSASRFDQARVLTANTGMMLLGGGSAQGAVLYPNQRGPSGQAVRRRGLNQDFVLGLEDVSPREDTYDIPSVLSDNVPPTYADPTLSPNPNGSPTGNGHGAVAYEMVDAAAIPVSRLGPWGGLDSLTSRSLLGGGAPSTGATFVLQGGQPIARPTRIFGIVRAAN